MALLVKTPTKAEKSGQNPGGANVLSEDIPSGWTDQQIWDAICKASREFPEHNTDVLGIVAVKNGLERARVAQVWRERQFAAGAG